MTDRPASHSALPTPSPASETPTNALFFVAVFPSTAGDEGGRVVYAEVPRLATADLTEGSSLDDDFATEDGELCVEIPNALRSEYLLAFEGTMDGMAAYHASECGCDDPFGEDCDASGDPDWSFIVGGAWRIPTVTDLNRAGMVHGFERAATARRPPAGEPVAFGVINKDGDLLGEIAACSRKEPVEHTIKYAQDIADERARYHYNATWAPYTVVPLYRHPAAGAPNDA